jgi:hypothetical protein
VEEEGTREGGREEEGRCPKPFPLIGEEVEAEMRALQELGEEFLNSSVRASRHSSFFLTSFSTSGRGREGGREGGRAWSVATPEEVDMDLALVEHELLTSFSSRQEQQREEEEAKRTGKGGEEGGHGEEGGTSRAARGEGRDSDGLFRASSAPCLLLPEALSEEGRGEEEGRTGGRAVAGSL